MAAASDVLRPYFLNGLANVSGLTSTTFKMWLESELFFLDNYSESELNFYIHDKEKFIKSIAFDVSRMSIAAFESISSVSADRELPRSTAWPLIRSYYAAFFSAHTIMRILGYGVVQLEKSQTGKLSTALRYHASPPSQNIQDGLYLVKISNQEPIFSLTKLNNGSHEDTWTVIAKLLIDTSNKFLLDKNPIDRQKKQDIFNQIDLLTKIMKTHPCQSRANWLSKIRNEINYQHKYGVWFPHEKSKIFRDKVYDNLSSWTKTPQLSINESNHFLDKYTQACTFLVSLARELILDISERNVADRSFLKPSTIKILKQAENN